MRFKQLLLAAAVLAGLGVTRLPGLALAGTGPSESSTPAVRAFTLYATDGYTTMPDGKQIYIWGYSSEPKAGTAILPGPEIRVRQDERVEIKLVNLGPSRAGGVKAAHTIHLHGLDVDTANDGVPHTSRELAVGESHTYRFTAPHAGTYWYHCHVDTVEHLQMGMYGAVVVLPPDGSQHAWENGPAYDRETTMLLSEIDPAWHGAVRDRKAYDHGDYRPRYHLINGKAFPDVAQDPASTVQGDVGDRVLVRLINAGYTWKSMHMHGFHLSVIASDGRPLPAPWDKDTISIAPGERYDLLVELNQKGAYPFHSHVILDNLNDGVYPGGLHTMVYSGVPMPAEHSHSGKPETTERPFQHGHHGTAGDAPAESAPLLTPNDNGVVEIRIQNNRFVPATFRIKAGTTVVWRNQDLFGRHTVTSAAFDSGKMTFGAEFRQTFTTAGAIDYWCDDHAAMTGKMIVE